MDKNNFSFYFMKNNEYLGDCFVIVYKATAQEIFEDSLTGDHILFLVKFGKPVDTEKIDLDYFNFINVNNFDLDKPILLRIGSECLFGTYGDSHCDCEQQRINALKAINYNGQGVYVHMPQEGQGRGLHYKASELELQVSGRNPEGKYIGEKSINEAYELLLGHDVILDIRSLKIIKYIFSTLGLDKLPYVLVTSNPNKVGELAGDLEIIVQGVADVNREITIDNISEYLSKLYHKNQDINAEEMLKITDLLKSVNDIPMRIVNISAFIKEDIERGRKLNADINLLKSLIEEIDKKTHNKSNAILTYKKNTRLLQDKYSKNSISNELEYSFLVDNEIFEKLVPVLGRKYIYYTAFEINRHFDLINSNLLEISGKILKIRTSYNILGMDTDCSTRFIYKTPTISNGKDAYETINTEIQGDLNLELMNANPLYCQSKEREVVTHVCKISEDLNILIKHYPALGTALEIKGDPKSAEEYYNKIKTLNHVKKVDIESLLDSYGYILKFSKSQKESVIALEKENARKYLQKNINILAKVFSHTNRYIRP